MTDEKTHWMDRVRLQLWTIGHRSSLMSIRELWELVFHPTIILLSTAVGSTAGISAAIALMALGDEGYYFVLAFCFIPQLVNMSSAGLISLVMFLKQRRRPISCMSPVLVPTALSVHLSATPIIFLVYLAKLLVAGAGPIDLIYEVTFYPIGYTLISEFFHYVVFRHIALSIWGRDPIWRLTQEADRTGVATTERPRTTASAGMAATEPPTDRWCDLACLSIWISGVASSRMSIRELWAIVFSKTVLILSMLIGTAAAVASAVTLKAVGDETYFYLVLFSVAPVIVNIGSAALMSAWVYVKVRRRSGDSRPNVSIPSLLTIYLAALPAISAIYFLKLKAGGLGQEWLIYVLTIAPLCYVLISDFFHYIVFTFITPSIWQRPHIYPSEGAAEKSQPKPEFVAPQQPPRTVTIGNTSFVETDLIFLEAQGNYLRVVTKTSEDLERFRISAAVERLSNDLGLFVHRSYWVAYLGIDRVSVVRGKCLLYMTGNEVISVASTRQEQVMTALQTRNLITT